MLLLGQESYSLGGGARSGGRKERGVETFVFEAYALRFDRQDHAASPSHFRAAAKSRSLSCSGARRARKK